MSLEMTSAPRVTSSNNDGAKDIPAVHIKSPVLHDEDAEAIMAIEGTCTTQRVDLRTPTTAPRAGAPIRPEGDVRRRGEGGQGEGSQCVVLSDKPSAGADMRPSRRCSRGRRAPPPHPRAGAHARVLVVESATRLLTHHVACLVGYGASAVNPYSRWRRAARGARPRRLRTPSSAGRCPTCPPPTYSATRHRAQGGAQDPVEDGHLAAHLLPRRADLRGDRPRRRADRHRVRRAPCPRASAASTSTSSRTETAMFGASNGAEKGRTPSGDAPAAMFQVKPGSSTTQQPGDVQAPAQAATSAVRAKAGDAYKLYEEHEQRAAGDDPRPARDQAPTASRSTSRRSSPSRTSASASAPVACPSAPSLASATRRSPSP